MLRTTAILGFLGCCFVCILADVATEDDWIDPLDPFSHDPTKVERDYQKYKESRRHSENTEEVENIGESVQQQEWKEDTITVPVCSCIKEKKKIETLEEIVNKKPVPHQPYYKQFVTTFVRQLDSAHKGTFYDSSRFQVYFDVTDADIDMLKEFVAGSGEGNVRDVHSIIGKMVTGVVQVDIPEDSVWDIWQWIVPCAWVLTALATSAIAINMQWRIGIPWMRIVGSILVLLFLISVPWTWWHLYQKEIVIRMSKSQGEPPVECRPQDMSLAQYIWTGLSIKNKCEEYYQTLHINPLLVVTPSKAVAVTITKFCLEPLEHLGESLGKMIKACLQDLPVQLWPIALVFLMVVLLVILIMSCGYKIRLFGIFGLEPTIPAIQATDGRALEQIQGINEEMKSLRATMEKHCQSVSEQLGGPIPKAIPSIKPGEILPITSGSQRTQQTSGSPLHGVHLPQSRSGYTKWGAASQNLAGSEVPPSRFRFAPPGYGAATRPRNRPREEDQVEDADVDSSEPAPEMKKGGKIKKRKKPGPVKSVSDTSLKAPTSYFKEVPIGQISAEFDSRNDDEMSEESNGLGADDADMSESQDATDQGDTISVTDLHHLHQGEESSTKVEGTPASDSILKVSVKGEETSGGNVEHSAKIETLKPAGELPLEEYPQNVLTKFDSLVIHPDDGNSSKGSTEVEEVGSSDARLVVSPNIDSSDDSDLEIIEEEPDDLHNVG